MAKGEKKEVRETVYTLTLSADEIMALRDVLSNVGGDIELSRRKFTKAVNDEIYKIFSMASHNCSDLETRTSGIFFKSVL